VISSGRVAVGGGEVAGDSGLLETPLNIPSDRDSFLASRDPGSPLSSANARIRKSSGVRCT
jgi:hypothetical protein